MNLDRQHMARALALAERGHGRVSPNPMVGAVVARGGRVVGEGYHVQLGGAHAEVMALSRAGGRARGATLYVTLEPCCHQGRTGPCTRAVVSAGVTRVVAAMRDPNPLVAGRGFAELRRHHVAVEVGLGGGAARLLNRSFVKHVSCGLPYVTLKEAVSLDGRIALASGHSRWITGAGARRLAHVLRRESDAVLVGLGTALADDPELSVRRGARIVKPVLRVVLDAGLRLPASARLLRQAASAGPVRVYCSRSAGRRRRLKLEACGASVAVVPSRSGRLNLEAVLRDLGSRGVGRLLVEGGGEVAASFLGRGLVDRVVLHMAPIFLGGDARAAVAGLGLSRLAEVPRLVTWTSRRVGRDLILEGEVRTGVHRHH